MANANIAILIGRLTKDTELRYTGNGKAVANFDLAVNRTYGKDKDDTIFIECTAWDKLAEVCTEYLAKGSTVFVKGRIHQDKWHDKEGRARMKHGVTIEEIQFLDSKGGHHSERRSPTDAPDGIDMDQSAEEFADDINDGDVPF